jgi:FK506-binding protein 2
MRNCLRQGLVGICLAVAITEVTSLVTNGSNGQNVKLEQNSISPLKLSKDHDKPPCSCLTSSSRASSRRRAISFIGTIVLGGLATTTNAAVTDETDNFGENWWTGDITKSPFVDAAASTPTKTRQSQATNTDEKVILIPKEKLKGGLGIELGEIEFRTNIRVYVKSVTPGSAADILGIQKDWIVVGLDGQSTERTNAEGVAILVSRAVRGGGEGDTLEFRFRDSAIFRDKLEDLQGGQVTTQVAPGGDTTQRNQDGSVKAGRSVTEQEDQRLTVAQLVPPKRCTHGAETDDLLEISYIGRVLETGAIFDGSAVKINDEGIAGRGNDVSIYFVLGKQPFGQFPPGWDVGLYGICVGERRRLIIPPAMAYGATGLPRRGIPPNAALQYDVTLVSVNGLATP